MGTIWGNNVEHINDIKNCQSYGLEQASYTLAQFISSVDTVTSEIGEYRKAYRPGGENFIVSGLQMENVESPIHILADLSTSIEVSGKFKNFQDKSPMQLIKIYLNTLTEEKNEYKQAVIDKLKGIINNKHLVIPFKPLSECTVTVEKEGQTFRDIQTKIYSVMWGMDKESGKFISKVLAKVENIGNASKTYKIPITNYGQSFTIASIERGLKSSNVDRRTVSMSRFGFIKPLVIDDGRIVIALDGTNMYLIMNNVTTIIGVWGNNGDLRESEVAKSLNKHKAYKFLKSNLEYIEKHKRFIAPYELVDANEIKL